LYASKPSNSSKSPKSPLRIFFSTVPISSPLITLGFVLFEFATRRMNAYAPTVVLPAAVVRCPRESQLLLFLEQHALKNAYIFPITPKK